MARVQPYKDTTKAKNYVHVRTFRDKKDGDSAPLRCTITWNWIDAERGPVFDTVMLRERVRSPEDALRDAQQFAREHKIPLIQVQDDAG